MEDIACREFQRYLQEQWYKGKVSTVSEQEKLKFGNKFHAKTLPYFRPITVQYYRKCRSRKFYVVCAVKARVVKI